MELMIQSLKDLDHAASQLLAFAGERKKFAFTGEMGAGKTTLIKSICQQLGVQEIATSPTFSIINEYVILMCLENKVQFIILIYTDFIE